MIHFLLSFLFLSQAYAEGARLDLGYSGGRYITIREEYVQANLFAPFFLGEDRISFLDVQTYRFNSGNMGVSSGLGIRKDLSSASLLGANIYYDFLQLDSNRNFNQVGLGIEWLNREGDIRMNLYLPFGRKTDTSSFCLFNQLGDGFFATRRKVEHVYRGFDLEVGTTFMQYPNFSLYGALGPYGFRSQKNRFWGGHGRLLFEWGSTFSLKLRASYDSHNAFHLQAILQVSFPLNLSKGLLTQPVQRNGIILTDKCCDWFWNWND